jgi:polar amino acid transport system permease protein/polar amino acid transport system substrate-binding protein
MTRRVLLVVLALAARPAVADTLDRVREEGWLVWGADEEGGGPYVVPDPGAPGGLSGFEVDLAGMLAGELSGSLGRKVEARFAHGQWETLPQLLQTGRIDIVLNGYEWSPERAKEMLSTVPYYIYELRLLVRAGDPRIPGWEALGGPPRRKVGVLGGSAAEHYVHERFPTGQVDVTVYDGNTNAMGDVVSGRIDATVQDLPIAVYYGKDFPGLVAAGEPAAPGRYVIFLRKEDERLRDALNVAITVLRDRGDLRRLYERYGIWTKAQEDSRLLALPANGGGDSRGFFEKHAALILEAAGVTVFLSVASMPIAILVGLLVALGRLYGPRWLSAALAVYVEVLRGTPLMLQLFVIFFLLPSIGVSLPAIPAAILGLAINYSAYEAEVYRAGLQAVPRGQMEAALALGMSRPLALRRVIVPQAARIVIPAVTNDFIALFKDTSVCSVITVVELTKRYNVSVMNNPGEILPLAAVTAALYLAMSYPLSLLAGRMERRLRT